MTAVATTTGRSSGLRIVGLVAIAGVLLAVAALSRSNDQPYQLRSTGGDGLRGLQLVLEGFGATVSSIDADDVTAAAAGRLDAVFVPLAGSGSTAQVDRWRDYVRAGGHLVLGTPTRHLGVEPKLVDDGSTAASDIEQSPGECTIDELTGLEDLAPSDVPSLAVPSGSTSCYGEGTTAQIVKQEIGRGWVVDIASADLFTNDLIRSHTQPQQTPLYDNVVVAQRLLDPSGNGRIGVVESGVAPAGTGPGTKGVLEFLRPGIRVGLLELLVVVALFALWQGRRHGRVVIEDQPVEIAGSELVVAVGDLQRRQHHPERAAAVMRAQTHRDLSRRLGVPVDAGPSVLAGLVAQRTNRDPDEVLAAMLSHPVQSESDLIEVARALETIRQEILHG